MELERAQITSTRGDNIEVQFNPNKFSLSDGNTIEEIKVAGLNRPGLQFVRGELRVLTMELFFDTYEQRTSVTDHTNRIYGLLRTEDPTHVPPICTFTWGEKFEFRCLLTKVDGSFTLFLADGTPVRATLNVTFKEKVDLDDQPRMWPMESADHTKTRTFRRGDTLSSIAAVEYGDPSKWRPIAEANRIENPRRVQPGRTLVIPSIE